MKKYLFIALAALGFAACTESGDEKTPVQNAEMEESYIAINLMAADSDTRAVTNDEYGNADQYGYEDGTALERKITSAHFFFFDANGNPFNVIGAPATAPGGGKNHLSLTLSTSEEKTTENISDISNAVLVLNTYKGVYPSQIVAVINWTPADKAYSLADLHSELATLGNDEKGYVMSNSVYMNDADKMVDAVPLTAANIKTNEIDAKAAPVEIYVERIAAKVVLTASGKVAGTDNIFDLGNGVQNTVFKPIGGSDIEVYMQLHGWELYNDYATSNLLKNISNWDIATLGLTWNDIPYFRCYWADSQETALNDKFEWSYGEGVNLNYGLAVGAHTYCGENTNQAVMTDGKITSDPRTKVILKGQLMQKNPDGTYSALEIAKWYGNEYAGEAALKIAVANSLKYTLYYPDPVNVGKYISIAPEDIMCVDGAQDKTDNVEAYEVYFKLSTTGEGKTWYKYSSENGYEVFGDTGVPGDNAAQTNAYLKSVEPALLYAKGQTYYSVDIEHLGTAGAKYGVVRNHVYQIDIQSITGYGSPVYSGDIGFLKPEYPTVEEDTYVAAKINVLSWKVVQQGVNIVQ